MDTPPTVPDLKPHQVSSVYALYAVAFVALASVLGTWMWWATSVLERSLAGILGLMGVTVVVVYGYYASKRENRSEPGQTVEAQSDSDSISLEDSPSHDDLTLAALQELAEEVEYNRRLLTGVTYINTLLRELTALNNIALREVVPANRKEPFEVWQSESAKRTKLFMAVQNILRMATHSIKETVGEPDRVVRRAIITVVGRDGHLHTISSDGLHPSEEKAKVFRIGDARGAANGCGIAGHVAHSRQPICVPDVTKDDRYFRFPETPKYLSLLCVPIKWDNRVLGTFSIDGVEEGCYTEDDVETALAFSHSIATALLLLMVKAKS